MRPHLLLIVSLVFCTSAQADIDALPVPINEGAFTAAWITDTQYYTEPTGDVGTLLKMTDWLKRYQAERDIRFLVHTGDITNRNTPTQWSRIEACMDVLNNSMPCFLAIGNHDMGPNGKATVREVSNFNKYFKLSDNPLTTASICSVYEPGHLENACYFYDYGKWSLLILSLEFATRPAVVAWADSVISNYPDRKVILITHDFIDYNSTRWTEDGRPLRSTQEQAHGYAASYQVARTEAICSAEDIWQQLINKHSNFILTLNGHFGSEITNSDGTVVRDPEYVSSYRVDKTTCGNYVHQVMFNPQFLKSNPASGGHGWLRLLEFQPDGQTINFRTFSPFYAMDGDAATSPILEDKWEQFSININAGTRTSLVK